MSELLLKLLEIIGQPTVIAIGVAAALILAAMRRVYALQHKFLREQFDVSRQLSNGFESRVSELNREVVALQSENERLRVASATLTELAMTLRHQAAESETRLKAFIDQVDSLASIQTRGFASLEQALRHGAIREVTELLGELVEELGRDAGRREARLVELQSRLRQLGHG
jgi:hypothetical protein